MYQSHKAKKKSLKIFPNVIHLTFNQLSFIKAYSPTVYNMQPLRP